MGCVPGFGETNPWRGVKRVAPATSETFRMLGPAQGGKSGTHVSSSAQQCAGSQRARWQELGELGRVAEGLDGGVVERAKWEEF